MADDDRDERLAAWLEPEPLDDVTRRRLVSTAIRESRDSRTARWVAAAAAIVVVLVFGLAVVTAQGGGDEHEAATPPRTPASGQSGAAAVAPEAATKADAPVALGDLGDLDQPANRAKLRTTLEDATSGFATQRGGATSDASSETASSDALPCRDQLPAGTVVAVGSGTLEGREVVVVFTDLGEGGQSIDAVLTGPCEVRSLS